MHILSSRERPRVCTVESKFWLENVQKTSSRRTQCTVKFQVKHKSRLQKYKERNKWWPYFSPVRGFWWYPVQNFLWQYLSSSIAPSSIHRFMYEDTKEAHGELCHAVAPPRRIISISSLETLVRGGWVEAEPPESKEAPFAPPWGLQYWDIATSFAC